MTFNEVSNEIHVWAKAKGFWDKERNFGEMLMLMTSELAEALEADRDGEPKVWFRHKDTCVHAPLNDLYDLMQDRENCTCTPKPEGTAIELIDCQIRILDTLGSMDVDIDDLVRIKMEYNGTRPRMHGKAY